MNPVCRWLVLVVVGGWWSNAWLATSLAQVEPATLRGESVQLRKRLADLMQKMQAQRWSEILVETRRILEEAPDELVTLDGIHHRTARWWVQWILCRMPEDVRSRYRQKVDPIARSWWTEGQKHRDRPMLLRIVQEYFVSTPCRDALLLLGDLALERGELDEAERFWGMLGDVSVHAAAKPASEVAGPASEAGPRLRYPDPGEALPIALARSIVAKMLRGIDVSAEVASFGQRYPQATGRLAGQNGNLAQRLRTLLEQAESMRWSQPGDNLGWTTYAGSPSRSSVARSGAPRYLANHPTWRTKIPSEPAEDRRRPKLPDDETDTWVNSPAGALVFHPLIVQDRILLADSCRVFSIDPTTGRLSKIHDLRDTGRKPRMNLELPSPFDLRYTLTAAEGRVLARLGVQGLRPPSTPNDVLRLGDSDSHILCLAPARGKKWANSLIAYWQLPATLSDRDPPAIWEGTPLIVDQHLLGLQTRFEGGRAVSVVTCHEGLDEDDLPTLRWQTPICEVPFNPNAEPRYRHDLLTLAGPNVVYCTHQGWVVAVDRLSGKRVWAFRYASSERRATEFSTPTRNRPGGTYADGRIFVAPADSRSLFALDAWTGELLWEVPDIEVIQILGVAADRVICTTAGGVRGLRGLNVRTGSSRAGEGWVHHDDGGAGTMGRGLIAEGIVLWPTRQGIHFVDALTGELVRPPLRDIAGNLALADGTLVVATATEVLGFRADPIPLPPRPGRTQIDAPPKPPSVSLPSAETMLASTRPLVIPLSRSVKQREAECYWIDDRLLRRRHEGKTCWQRELPLVPTSIVVADDVRFAWSHQGIVAFHATDGSILWHWPSETSPWAERERRPAAFQPLSPLEPPRLCQVVVAHGYIGLHWDKDRFQVLQAATGKLIWSGRVPTFEPTWIAEARCEPWLELRPAAIALGRGSRFVIQPLPTGSRSEPTTLGHLGERIARYSTPQGEWFLASESGVVACWDAQNRPCWQVRLPLGLAPTVQAPKLVWSPQGLLVGFLRESVMQWHCLASDTGRPLWPNPLMLEDASAEIDANSLSGGEAWAILGNELLRIDLHRGQVVGRLPHPQPVSRVGYVPSGGPAKSARWHLAVGGDTLLLWSQSSAEATLLPRWLRPHADLRNNDDRFTLWIVDRATGEPMHRCIGSPGTATDAAATVDVDVQLIGDTLWWSALGEQRCWMQTSEGWQLRERWSATTEVKASQSR